MSHLAIRAENVTKRFRLGDQARYHTFAETLKGMATAPFRQKAAPLELTALDDVCFDIRAGEAVGLIGRNGAGKSTLLKVLSRITAPTHGRVELRGRLGSLLEVGAGFH